MKQWVVLGLVALLVLFGSGAVLAQQDPGVPTGIGDITGDSASFYGQTVQIQGIIGEFISTNAFVLTDAAALSNANVLVINNSGRPIPNSYVKGQEVIVTGRVHPSYSEIFNGNVGPFPSYFEERGGMMGSGTTGSGMATQDPAMMSTPTLVPTTDLNGTPIGGAADPNATPMVTPANPDAGASTGSTDAGSTMLVTPVGGTGDTSVSVSTSDVGMTGMMNSYEEDLLAWVYGDMLPDEYDVYTIIELVSIEQLMYPSDLGQ